MVLLRFWAKTNFAPEYRCGCNDGKKADKSTFTNRYQEQSPGGSLPAATASTCSHSWKQ